MKLKKILWLLGVLLIANYFSSALFLPLFYLLHADLNFIYSNPVMPWFVDLFPILVRITLLAGVIYVARKVWHAQTFREALGKGVLGWIPTFAMAAIFAPSLLLYSAVFPYFFMVPATLGGLDDTSFAPQFSYKKFPSIQVGQDEKELKRLVGEPLQTSRHGEEQVFWYTRPARGGDYWNVKVILDEQGKVAEKKQSYYFD